MHALRSGTPRVCDKDAVKGTYMISMANSITVIRVYKQQQQPQYNSNSNSNNNNDNNNDNNNNNTVLERYLASGGKLAHHRRGFEALRTCIFTSGPSE